MAKKLDVVMLISIYVIILYSSVSMMIEGFIKSVPATDVNIILMSISGLIAVVGSNWGSFYVDENETLSKLIIKSVKKRESN